MNISKSSTHLYEKNPPKHQEAAIKQKGIKVINKKLTGASLPVTIKKHIPEVVRVKKIKWKHQEPEKIINGLLTETGDFFGDNQMKNISFTSMLADSNRISIFF